MQQGWSLPVKNVQLKSHEEALETLRLATEAASVGIWDWNVQTDELHWSDLTKKCFGISTPGSVTMAVFIERLHPEDRQRVGAAVEGALDPNGPGEYEADYRILRPNGEERYAAARGKAYFEEIGGKRTATRFTGTLIDRTDQKRSEAALVQAEQLATTGRLAASIAHEINNPLEAVTNFLYLLRDEQDETTRKEYVRAAELELARVSEIASNTLRFYRDPKGVVRVGMSALIQSVMGLFQGRVALRGVDLDVDCENGAEVMAYQGELRQVLVNLVGNALDAMPKGGRLRVHCRTFPGTVENLPPRVEVSIADTGSGMSPGVLERAFEPFYTTKGSAGTGLGLWLSREILKKHGFKLKVRSKPTAGTVFTISMPIGTSLPENTAPSL